MVATTHTKPKSTESTFSALKNPNYRLYFIGLLVSFSGSWMQSIAQGYLVFQLTQDELWLGIVGCANGLPVLLLSLFGGVVVERFSRRRLILITQTIQMLQAFALAALTFAGVVQVWHVVALAFILGLTNSLDLTARQTFVMELVGREELQSGIALNSLIQSSSRVFGPSLAGIVLVQVGTAWCFFINGLSFLAVIASLLIIEVPYALQRFKQSRPIQQLKEGLAFVRANESIQPLLLLAAKNGFLVISIIRIYPAFADVVLHSPKQGYAAIVTAQGIGSVLAGVLIGRLVYRLGRGRVIMLMSFLVAMMTFGVSLQRTIPLAMLMTGLFGYCLISLNVSVNTQIQTLAPDEFRGRVLSLFILCFFGTSPFGALVLGYAAQQIGTPNAIAACAVFDGITAALIILRWRKALTTPVVYLPTGAVYELDAQ